MSDKPPTEEQFLERHILLWAAAWVLMYEEEERGADDDYGRIDALCQGEIFEAARRLMEIAPPQQGAPA